MTTNHFSFGDKPFDLRVAHSVLQDELAVWERNVSAPQISEVQDLRSLLIEWAAVMMPEAMPPTFQQRLTKSLTSIRAGLNYETDGWHRCIALDFALWALTRDEDWLRVAASNIDHHNSQLRHFIETCLALIAPTLDFTCKMMRQTQRNMLVGHMGHERMVAVFLVSAHSGQFKREQIRLWLHDYTLHENVAADLKALLDGGTLPNPFGHDLLWIQQYSFLRFAIQENDAAAAPPSFVPPDARGSQLSLFRPNRYVDVVWQRCRDHPLCQDHLWLRDERD